MKTCTRCGFIGGYDRFYKQSMNSKDGYQSHCKSCDNVRVKKWALNNPEKAKQHTKKADANKYLKIKTLYLLEIKHGKKLTHQK